jgi:hypothetical protein
LTSGAGDSRIDLPSLSAVSVRRGSRVEGGEIGGGSAADVGPEGPFPVVEDGVAKKAGVRPNSRRIRRVLLSFGLEGEGGRRGRHARFEQWGRGRQARLGRWRRGRQARFEPWRRGRQARFEPWGRRWQARFEPWGRRWQARFEQKAVGRGRHARFEQKKKERAV